MSTDESIPTGLCQCGCGGAAPIARKTRRGYVKGESMKFILGHHMRMPRYKEAVFTEERNQKIRAAHADGRIPSPHPGWGAKNPSWRGDDINYAGVHSRLLSHRGPASAHRCAKCRNSADEWALNHDHPAVRRADKPFSTDVSAYLPLCRSCHRLADRNGGYRA